MAAVYTTDMFIVLYLFVINNLRADTCGIQAKFVFTHMSNQGFWGVSGCSKPIYGFMCHKQLNSC